MNRISGLFRRASLSQKLIVAFLILITAPIVLNGALMFQKAQNVLEGQSTQSANAAISYIQEKIERYLEDMEFSFVDIYNYKTIFSSLSEKKESPPSSRILETETIVNDQLKLYQAGNEEFEQVYLLSAGGHIFYSSYQSKNYALIQKLFQDQETMEKIRERDGKSLDLVLTGPEGSKMCLAKTVKNIYGGFEPIGTAIVILKDQNIPSLLSTYPYSGDLSLYLINAQGQVAFQQNVSPYLNKNLKNLSEFSAQLPGDEGTAAMRIGDKQFRTYYSTGSYFGWRYVELLDEEMLLSQTMEVKDYFFFVSILSLFFFWIVIFVTARTISRPIHTLVRGMERMKAGDLSVPVEIRSEDEIGVLSRTFNEMQGEIKGLIQNIQTISNREKEMEINYLKTQINPHFLYNVLGSVNWMATQKNEPEISNVITDISDLLRYCLDKNTDDIVTVQEDLQWLSKYVDLQRMRYTNGFHFIVNADPMVQGCKIHKLMLQPLVENALMHGGCGSAQGALIVVFIQGTQDGIYFEITDNGLGMTPEQAQAVLKAGSGLGLKNVNERLKLYFGEDYGLQIVSQPGDGVKISFTMPFLEET